MSHLPNFIDILQQIKLVNLLALVILLLHQTAIFLLRNIIIFNTSRFNLVYAILDVGLLASSWLLLAAGLPESTAIAFATKGEGCRRMVGMFCHVVVRICDL